MKGLCIALSAIYIFCLSSYAQTNSSVVTSDNKSEIPSVAKSGDKINASKTNEVELSVVETNVTKISVSECPVEIKTEKKKHGLGHKILFYIPNRALDLVDIFRLRAKVGPGISGGIRLTSVASFYGGKHNTIYVGLPGPRAVQKKPRPWGREKEKGITFFGVDATDDSKHEPEHSPSEIGMEVHLLLVGIDAGVDPVEFGDFLAGWIGKDPRGDDR